jgi:MFS family permease
MMATLETQFNARLEQTALGFGVAFSALTVSRLLFQVPLGSLSDRVGRKPVIVAGLVALMPTTVLLGLVGSTMQLTAVRLAQGVASAGIAAPAFALAGDVSIAGGEGRQLSVLTMGFGLGIALGPLLAGLLAVVSFEAPFAIGGVLALVAAAVVYRYAPETAGEDADA